MVKIYRAIVFGSSYQGRIALEILRTQGNHKILGFLDDDASKHGTVIDGLSVLGGFNWVKENVDKDISALVAIGNNDTRVKISKELRAHGIKLLNAIHPSAVIMRNIVMGRGNLICAGVILVAGTRLENDIVVNTGVTVDHDSIVKSGAYLSPGVHTAGRVSIGRGTFIGLGTIIGPGVSIGDQCIIGAGSLVLSDLPSKVFVQGSPAKVIRKLDDSMDWKRILCGK
jgi:acetyltransferase EpsM